MLYIKINKNTLKKDENIATFMKKWRVGSTWPQKGKSACLSGSDQFNYWYLLRESDFITYDKPIQRGKVSSVHKICTISSKFRHPPVRWAQEGPNYDMNPSASSPMTRNISQNGRPSGFSNVL